eukprot:PhF_6_TR37528/c0_g1_i7/m.55525
MSAYEPELEKLIRHTQQTINVFPRDEPGMTMFSCTEEFGRARAEISVLRNRVLHLEHVSLVLLGRLERRTHALQSIQQSIWKDISQHIQDESSKTQCYQAYVSALDEHRTFLEHSDEDVSISLLNSVKYTKVKQSAQDQSTALVQATQQKLRAEFHEKEAVWKKQIEELQNDNVSRMTELGLANETIDRLKEDYTKQQRKFDEQIQILLKKIPSSTDTQNAKLMTSGEFVLKVQEEQEAEEEKERQRLREAQDAFETELANAKQRIAQLETKAEAASNYAKQQREEAETKYANLEKMKNEEITRLQEQLSMFTPKEGGSSTKDPNTEYAAKIEKTQNECKTVIESIVFGDHDALALPSLTKKYEDMRRRQRANIDDYVADVKNPLISQLVGNVLRTEMSVLDDILRAHTDKASTGNNNNTSPREITQSSPRLVPASVQTDPIRQSPSMGPSKPEGVPVTQIEPPEMKSVGVATEPFIVPEVAVELAKAKEGNAGKKLGVKKGAGGRASVVSTPRVVSPASPRITPKQTPAQPSVTLSKKTSKSNMKTSAADKDKVEPVNQLPPEEELSSDTPQTDYQQIIHDLELNLEQQRQEYDLTLSDKEERCMMAEQIARDRALELDKVTGEMVTLQAQVEALQEQILQIRQEPPSFFDMVSTPLASPRGNNRRKEDVRHPITQEDAQLFKSRGISRAPINPASSFSLGTKGNNIGTAPPQAAPDKPNLSLKLPMRDEYVEPSEMSPRRAQASPRIQAVLQQYSTDAMASPRTPTTTNININVSKLTPRNSNITPSATPRQSLLPRVTPLVDISLQPKPVVTLRTIQLPPAISWEPKELPALAFLQSTPEPVMRFSSDVDCITPNDQSKLNGSTFISFIDHAADVSVPPPTATNNTTEASINKTVAAVTTEPLVKAEGEEKPSTKSLDGALQLKSRANMPLGGSMPNMTSSSLHSSNVNVQNFAIPGELNGDVAHHMEGIGNDVWVIERTAKGTFQVRNGTTQATHVRTVTMESNDGKTISSEEAMLHAVQQHAMVTHLEEQVAHWAKKFESAKKAIAILEAKIKELTSLLELRTQTLSQNAASVRFELLQKEKILKIREKQMQQRDTMVSNLKTTIESLEARVVQHTMDEAQRIADTIAAKIGPHNNGVHQLTTAKIVKSLGTHYNNTKIFAEDGLTICAKKINPGARSGDGVSVTKPHHHSPQYVQTEDGAELNNPSPITLRIETPEMGVHVRTLTPEETQQEQLQQQSKSPSRTVLSQTVFNPFSEPLLTDPLLASSMHNMQNKPPNDDAEIKVTLQRGFRQRREQLKAIHEYLRGIGAISLEADVAGTKQQKPNNSSNRGSTPILRPKSGGVRPSVGQITEQNYGRSTVLELRGQGGKNGIQVHYRTNVGNKLKEKLELMKQHANDGHPDDDDQSNIEEELGIVHMPQGKR